jgi:integrase
MNKRHQPDSIYLFPSPIRGSKDIPVRTLMESFKQARSKAKLTHLGFHDMRHYFISHCVMSGIDCMTIAKWVGHKDGGILIGKVYGHLSPEHEILKAKQVKFSN